MWQSSKTGDGNLRTLCVGIIGRRVDGEISPEVFRNWIALSSFVLCAVPLIMSARDSEFN